MSALTSLVGRDVELAHLTTMVETSRRLVALVGAPGIGKTRLALEYGLTFRGDGGAWLCDLSDADGAFDLVAGVAHVLGVPLRPGLALDQAACAVGHAMAHRGDTLVILDSFDRVVQDGAEIVGQWASTATNVCFLATTRAHPGVAGEVVFEVPPLSLPTSEHKGLSSDAVRLFVDRARSLKAFVPSATDIDAIGEIVAQLGGIPLAIEMASSRTSVLAPTQLLCQLKRGTSWLKTPFRGAPARHQTLHSAIDWSWQMLPKREQAALAQLSVFRGGFTLAAATAIVGTGACEAIDVLQALCDRSLVYGYHATAGAHELRYSLLDSIRDYASARLDELGLGTIAEARHAGFVAGEIVELQEHTGGTGAHHDRVRLEQDNLRSVCDRMLASAHVDKGMATNAVTAAIALNSVLSVDGRSSLAISLLERTLAAASTFASDELFAQAMSACARTHYVRDELDASAVAYESALASSRKSGSVAHELDALLGLGIIAGARLQSAKARELFEAVNALAATSGSVVHQSRALGNLGWIASEAGELQDAQARYEQAIPLLRKTDQLRGEAVAWAELGEIALERNDLASAHRNLSIALAQSRELGDRWVESMILRDMADCLDRQRCFIESEQSYQDALDINRALGDRKNELICVCNIARAFATRSEVDQAQRYIQQAEQLALIVDGTPSSAPVLFARAHLELALARRAQHAHAESSAAAHLERARQLVEDNPAGSPSCVGEPIPVRALRSRFLRIQLADFRRAAVAAQAGHSCAETSPAPPTMQVCASGRWFCIIGEPRVELATRSGPRRLLRRLLEARETQVDAAVTPEQLFDYGWPGVHLAPDIAASRVYVALYTLRKLGLKRVLIRRDDGYLLDPSVRVLSVAEVSAS